MELEGCIEALDALRTRIECIARHPDRVRAPWTRLARPILKGMGWQPAYTVAALTTLLYTSVHEGSEAEAELTKALDAAVREFEHNVAQAERACVLHGKLGVAHTAWLGRQLKVMREIAQAPNDPWMRDPLVLAELRRRALEPLAVRNVVEAFGSEVSEVPRTHRTARVVDFHLAAVDALIDLSHDSVDFLGRRRQVLEAARMQLLDISAALPLELSGVRDRQDLLAREIARLDRLQAAGLSPDVSLLHQCRSALAQGDRARLHAGLVALDERAKRRGDRVASARASAALDRMWAGRDRYGATERVRSQELSTEETLGRPMLNALREGYAAGRARNTASALQGATAQQYLALGGEGATMAAALTASGLVEVGGSLSPVRVIDHEPRERVVPFPTQRMVLADARSVEDLAHAVIEDPRTVLLALAEGRLLTRRFLRKESVARPRTRMVGEVRVYVLDGSGSMYMGPSGMALGARARVRDALLVAELATLAKRVEQLGRTTRVVLYYRYFDDLPGPLHKVDSSTSATHALDDVLGHVRLGGTNIERALIESFQLVREERERDPDLASAQVVLVTDGESPVSRDAVLAARNAAGADLPIRLSVIALGEENPVLRGLVAAQRARGEMAFYHFVPDETLRAIVTGASDVAQCLHAPQAPEFDALPPAARAEKLKALVGDLVEDLGELDVAASRSVESIEVGEATEEALGEVGLDGAKAWRDALRRDRKAVEKRFLRWFPTPVKGTEAVFAVGDADLDAAAVLLATVAEVVEVVGGSELARRADAIEVIERLLPATELTPESYLSALQRSPEALASSLEAVHRAVKPG